MKLLLSILLLLLVGQGFAQEKIFIHPEEDPHWKAVVYDEFNDTIVNDAIWNSTPPWGPTDHAKTCDYTNYPTGYVNNTNVYAATTKEFKNLSVDTGILNIQTRREQYRGEVWKYTPSWVIDSADFNYTTGLLWSDSLYKYGYYEISVKLPQPDSTDFDKYSGLGPNFWLYNAEDYANGTKMRYSEIDIFEIQSHDPNDFDGKPNNRYTRNFHFLCDTLPGCPTDSFFHADFYGDDINVEFNSFKSFAAYWSENSIDYYHEDSIVNSSQSNMIKKIENINLDTVYTEVGKFNHSQRFYPMYIIIDNYVPGRQFCMSQTDSTQMPYDYLIGHVKVWQLKNACDSDLVVADINPATYDYTVKQNIELGNGGGVLSSGEDLILRANESITLKSGYEALNGSELTLVISDCMSGAGVYHPQHNPGGTESEADSLNIKSTARPIFYPIE